MSKNKNELVLTEAERFILNTVKKHTQYSMEDLQNRQALLEEELGIDSIILGSILHDLTQAFGASGVVSAQGFSTLDGLLQAFSAFSLKVELSTQQAEKAQCSGNQFVAEKTMKNFMSDGSSDPFSKVYKFSSFLKEKTQSGHFWYGMASHSACDNRVRLFDEYAGCEREFLMFASNNYLGMANDPRVIEAICEATKLYGATNTGCRLIGGTNHLHLELESKLADLKGREACIVFPSGYSANLGVISALLGPNDTVITDVYNHMSIQDGCKLSGAKRKIFKHNDMHSLETVLRQVSESGGGKLIVADGVFSMHGDIVQLPELLKLAKKYQARVLIDDAHSTGVLGKKGSGTAEYFDQKGAVDIEIGTMSKALAGMGGFAVADAELVDYLRYYANSYVFAATIPAGVAAGLIKSIDLMQQEPERIQQLWANIHYFKSSLNKLGFNTEHSESAIIPVVIGDETKAMEMGRSIRQRGMFCQTVVFPGVAVGDARLRISILSTHTRKDLDQAIEILLESAYENKLFIQQESA